LCHKNNKYNLLIWQYVSNFQVDSTCKELTKSGLLCVNCNRWYYSKATNKKRIQQSAWRIAKIPYHEARGERRKEEGART
jgi:hypothetical protein